MSKQLVALAVVALLVGLLLLIGPTLASNSSTGAISWWTIDSGGGSSSGTDEGARDTTSGFMLQGSIGQPDAGVLSGSSYSLIGGYWGMETAPTDFRLCLPVVVREP